MPEFLVNISIDFNITSIGKFCYCVIRLYTEIDFPFTTAYLENKLITRCHFV